MSGQFTGRHMTAILIAFFAVVVAVNVAMARYASSTFGGVVVQNSYVASQHFNRWLDEAAREDALGLRALATRTEDNRLSVVLSGENTTGAPLVVTARHPLGRTADRAFSLTKVENGRFLSREALPPGRWRLRIELGGARKTWRTEQEIF